MDNGFALRGEVKPRFHLPQIWTQRGGRSFDILWDDHWDHGVLHPLPTDEELHRFYSTADYDHYMEGVSSGPIAKRSWLDRLIDPFLYRAAAWFGEGEKLDARFVERRFPPPKTLLDIGCGPGLMISELQGAGYKVAGLDPSKVALNSARARGLRMYEGTAETLPGEVEHGFYDIVTMSQSLEHTREPILALRRAAEALKPGGTMIVEVPNCGSAGFKMRGAAWFHTDAGRHINFFTAKSLRAHFQSAGLEPLDCGYSGISHQFARLESEQDCWDALYGPGSSRGMKPRPSRLSRLALLARVIIGPDCARRDMVWLMGRKPIA